jgi:hypothetical protein
MPRFTVKDLLIAITLIAIGAGAWAFLFHNVDELERLHGPWLAPLLWFGGGPCIGAGLFTPFKRPWTGVITALVLQILLVMAGGAMGC